MLITASVISQVRQEPFLDACLHKNNGLGSLHEGILAL